ncbi:ligase [Brevibacillus antibioticus]|uniref:Ligase n=1 Tax=Brevibacillus antibioticus TaxID=2570228 RepID=A0A4V5TQQ7_9BACL|nr:O-antigen ligase family protein [Brevibacillus antibioticus]TKI54313.1 ligase [Brevibacillus antibioticus]
MMIKEKLSPDKVLLFLYVVLKPFYFFPSGNPQIADFIMLILIAYSFLFRLSRINRRLGFFLFLTLLFLYDIMMVNGIWAIALGGEMDVFSSTKWYMYNGAVMLALVFLFRRNAQEYVKWVFLATSTSLLIQAFILVSGLSPDSDEFRQSLFFNNPNQLGYFGLLCMGICLLCARFVSVKTIPLFIAIGTAFSIIAASLSKAAIISAVGMYLVFLLLSIKERTGLFWMNLLCVLVSSFAVFFIYLYTNENVLSDASIYTQIEERMVTLGEDSDDNLAARGYDRIANHPEYILFGAGEGMYERFNSSISLELHSTLANLFFSYGVTGTVLFILVMVGAVRGHRLVAWYPLVFQILYGLTHNGIRETFFWIMLALYFVTAEINTRQIKNGGDLLEKNLASMRN